MANRRALTRAIRAPPPHPPTFGAPPQVPCGIFDDPATVAQMKEMCVTIRKVRPQNDDATQWVLDQATPSRTPLPLRARRRAFTDAFRPRSRRPQAMVQINELHAAASPLNFNQMTRWVMTKEQEADKLITLVSNYCLCQRVKNDGKVFESEGDYVDALKAHHAVMQSAMKTKQTVDVAACDKLEHDVADMAKMYIKE